MKFSIAAFYNRISFIYPFIDLFLKKHRYALIKEVNDARPGKLLEIGVGNGVHLPLYSSHQVTGIDISEAMLNNAMRYKGENTQLILMNGEDLLFSEACFDYVVICHVLAVAKNTDQLLAQVYKVLKPGGKLFILNHFTPGNWLKYIDRAFQPLSFLFHFRSTFYLHCIKGLERFSLCKQIELGTGAYYKLLIYCKP